MKFCVETWQKMSQKTKDQLTDTAQNFFSFIRTVRKIKKDSLHEHSNIRKSNSRFN